MGHALPLLKPVKYSIWPWPFEQVDFGGTSQWGEQLDFLHTYILDCVLGECPLPFGSASLGHRVAINYGAQVRWYGAAKNTVIHVQWLSKALRVLGHSIELKIKPLLLRPQPHRNSLQWALNISNQLVGSEIDCCCCIFRQWLGVHVNSLVQKLLLLKKAVMH